MDLNLLVALDALLEENSVQAAADRLHLSAPAMSRTLTRIRKTMDDEILVRTGRTMTPTPRALAIREDVHALVHQAGHLLTPARTLDLSTLRRTFTIQGHDALLTELSLRLMTCMPDAPGVSLRFLAEPPTDTPDLARGHVDLDLSAAIPATPDISHQVVGHDRLVAIFHAGHPLEHFTLQRFAATEHIMISRRGRLCDGLDDLLAQQGLHRRVVSVVPTTAIALQTVACSHAVVVTAHRMTARACADLGLSTHPLDLDLPRPPVVLSWPSRYTPDPAHQWLRQRATSALQEALNTAIGYR